MFPLNSTIVFIRKESSYRQAGKSRGFSSADHDAFICRNFILPAGCQAGQGEQLELKERGEERSHYTEGDNRLQRGRQLTCSSEQINTL